MTDQHLLTPPRELVEQWRTEPEYVSSPRLLSIITMSENRLMEICQKSAQYGATCLPKSLALVEQGLKALGPQVSSSDFRTLNSVEQDTIRSVLERFKQLEACLD